MSKHRGLPPEKTMRHDSHFVEEITSQRPEALGRLIEIKRIKPNPNQPRKHFGDLDEMVSSIKEKGILQPILVRNNVGNFEIIAGERRYQAAKLAGLKQIPCIEVDVDARGMLEISLIENLQRRDLTPFEEAAAIERLSEQFRYTHEEIARKLGKSRTVITEVLTLNRIPQAIQDRCRQADINSKSMLLEIARQSNEAKMQKLVDKISEGLTREQARQLKREDGGSERRSRNFTFRYEPEHEAFQMRLTFNKAEAGRDELIRALREILGKLLAEAVDQDSFLRKARRVSQPPANRVSKRMPQAKRPRGMDWPKLGS